MDSDYITSKKTPVDFSLKIIKLHAGCDKISWKKMHLDIITNIRNMLAKNNVDY